MLGRASFPMMDNTVTLTLNVNATAAAAGKVWRGKISLRPPLDLDNRMGEETLLSFLKAVKSFAPPGVSIYLLTNSAPNPNGPEINPRKDVLYSFDIMVVLEPYVLDTTSKIIVYGQLAAPESPNLTSLQWQPLWANINPNSTSSSSSVPFTVETLNGLIIDSHWSEMSFGNVVHLYKIRNVSSSGNIEDIDQLIAANAASGNTDLLLPLCSSLPEGKYIVVKKTDNTGNRVRVSARVGNNVDGVAYKDILTAQQSLTFVNQPSFNRWLTV